MGLIQIPRIKVLLAVLIFATPPLQAANQADAIKIIDEMEAIYRGESSRADITMIVQTPQYQREMKMTSSAIGEEQSFIRILSPKKDRGIGTTFQKSTRLSKSHPR